VPLAAIAVWFLVVKGHIVYRKGFFNFQRFFLSYVVSAVMAKPDWSEIGNAMLKPGIQ
jgi:hypothetical protein